MTYRTYFDLKLRPDPEIPSWDRLGALWRLVHQAGAKSQAPFAVAFPGWMVEGFTLGPVFRVFTRSEAQANTLYDALDANPRCADLAEGARVKSAPAGSISFEAYRMHRLPSGVSKDRRTVPLDIAQALQVQARERRLAQQTAHPFVIMRSSTGHKFLLVVERMAAQADALGEPNGYGLSRATQIVALPVV
jgi:CRISPR-associated endoribonuclease Cas6/Csy4 subtype I-F